LIDLSRIAGAEFGNFQGDFLQPFQGRRSRETGLQRPQRIQAINFLGAFRNHSLFWRLFNRGRSFNFDSAEKVNSSPIFGGVARNAQGAASGSLQACC
jgi:hypothetical protein